MSSPHQSVPPAKSSHTAAAATETGSSPESPTPPQTVQVIRIPQTMYLAVMILVFCVFFPFVGWPVALFWLWLIPIAAAWWIARTRTTVSEAGLDLRTVLGSRQLDWSQVAGVTIPKRGYVRAHLTDDTDVKLPAVGYDKLRRLIKASNGRIPDLFAAEADAREAEYEARRAAEADAATVDSATNTAAETGTGDTDSRATGSQT